MTQGVEPRAESGDVLERSFRPVHAYALALLGPERAADAASAAAREAAAMALAELPPDRLEEIVQRSTRSAVSRMLRQAGTAPPGSTCDAVPGLLATRTSGSLTLDDADLLERHLETCVACSRLAGRFEAAEAFLSVRNPTSPELPHELVRDVAGMTVAAASPPAEPTPTPEPEPVAAAEPEPVAAAEPEPAVTPEPEASATPEPEPEPTAEAEPEATTESEPEATATAQPEPEPARTDETTSGNPWLPREESVIPLPEPPKKRRWFRRNKTTA